MVLLIPGNGRTFEVTFFLKSDHAICNAILEGKGKE